MNAINRKFLANLINDWQLFGGPKAKSYQVSIKDMSSNLKLNWMDLLTDQTNIKFQYVSLIKFTFRILYATIKYCIVLRCNDHIFIL